MANSFVGQRVDDVKQNHHGKQHGQRHVQQQPIACKFLTHLWLDNQRLVHCSNHNVEDISDC